MPDHALQQNYGGKSETRQIRRGCASESRESCVRWMDHRLLRLSLCLQYMVSSLLTFAFAGRTSSHD